MISMSNPKADLISEVHKGGFNLQGGGKSKSNLPRFLQVESQPARGFDLLWGSQMEIHSIRIQPQPEYISFGWSHTLLCTLGITQEMISHPDAPLPPLIRLKVRDMWAALVRAANLRDACKSHEESLMAASHVKNELLGSCTLTCCFVPGGEPQVPACRSMLRLAKCPTNVYSPHFPSFGTKCHVSGSHVNAGESLTQNVLHNTQLSTLRDPTKGRLPFRLSCWSQFTTSCNF